MAAIQEGVEERDHVAVTSPRVLFQLHAQLIRIFDPVDMRQFQVIFIQA